MFSNSDRSGKLGTTGGTKKTEDSRSTERQGRFDGKTTGSDFVIRASKDRDVVQLGRDGRFVATQSPSRKRA